MSAPLDWLVLTAANRAQARGYEAQLRARERAGALACCRRRLVVADPGGRRVGSGGSTLIVLHELAKKLARERRGAASIASLFENQRILIIHSGGDSRRLPPYAAQGKLFTPLPRRTADGREAELFDLVLDDLLGVPLPETGRVLIASGDVMLGVARHRPRVDAPGVAGVASPAPAERGSRHGVYIAAPDGRVLDFMQKPSPSIAAATGAMDEHGRVLVDLGLVSLDPPSAARWLQLAGVGLDERGRIRAQRGGLHDLLARGRAPTLDLYHHFLRAIPARIRREEYLVEFGDGVSDQAAVRIHNAVYDHLNGLPFSVTVVPDCDFLHIGSVRELLDAASPPAQDEEGRSTAPVVHNSYGPHTPRLRSGRGVVEACDLTIRLILEGENVVVGLPGGAGRTLRMPQGWGLACLPIGARDWAAVLFGTGDDCKTSMESGGTFGDKPLTEVLDRWGIAPRDLWGSGERTLWTARLWGVGPIDTVLRRSLWMCGTGQPPGDWKRTRRFSLAQLMPRVHHARMIAHRDDLRRRARLAAAAESLARDPWLPAQRILADVQAAGDAQRLLKDLERITDPRREPLRAARLLQLAHMAAAQTRAPRLSLAGIPARRFADEAMACVARAVESDLVIPRTPPAAAILPGQVAWATTPVRIDFHGGWSDTPPICHELGGRVVNGAITLNGQYPVQVMARLSDEPRIRLTSVDLGESVTLREAHHICAFSDPHDWAALPKAALVLAGIAPRSVKESLKRRLERFGGGLDLTMFAALPKGSGLGTSSILGAAILACIDRVTGREPDIDAIIRRTSLLEQMMSTAGGWQDQAGGITPGIKLLETSPGADQLPALRPCPLNAERAAELSGRSLLYYTGHQRLAKNILRSVVEKYLARDAETIRTLGRLKEGAADMAASLERGDIDAFAGGVLDYWQLKKAIDPGATNARIEAIIEPVSKYLTGYELPGAGGGGFVFMIARDPDSAAAVRGILLRRPPSSPPFPNRLARFYDFAIDSRGLGVSVL